MAVMTYVDAAGVRRPVPPTAHHHDGAYSPVDHSHVTDTGWIDLALTSKWVAQGSPYAVPGFRKLNGVVYLRGLARAIPSTLGTTEVISTLPAGFWPDRSLAFNCANSYAKGGYVIHATRINVSWLGYVSIFQWTAQTDAITTEQWVSLDNIRFVSA
jgi:hypothetical protein